jgi:hypothetical protein
MLRICREFGFSIAPDPNDPAIMLVRRALTPIDLVVRLRQLVPGCTERDCFAALAMTPQARHCEERSDEAISCYGSQQESSV